MPTKSSHPARLEPNTFAFVVAMLRAALSVLLHRSPSVTGATDLWNTINLENHMKFADECQRRALLLMEIAREAPDFEAQALFVAEQWLYWARSRR
jgi:hypothetical protein